MVFQFHSNLIRTDDFEFFNPFSLKLKLKRMLVHIFFGLPIFCFGDARAVTFAPRSLDTRDARAYETLDGCLHA